MGGTAVQAEEDTVGSGGPGGAGVGAVEANGIGGDVFEFTKLGIFGSSGDAGLAFASGGDGAVGFDVARHF